MKLTSPPNVSGGAFFTAVIAMFAAASVAVASGGPTTAAIPFCSIDHHEYGGVGNVRHELFHCQPTPLEGANAELVLNWTLLHGDMLSTEILQNTAGNSAFAECALKSAERWRFHPDLTGSFSYRLVF